MTNVCGSSMSFEAIEKAAAIVHQSPNDCKRTPLVRHWQDLGDCSDISINAQLYLKLENMQVTGSYKVRGILNQVHCFKERHGRKAFDSELVTMSAGNYGKAFAFLARDFKRRVVVMPNTAPANREVVIRGFGGDVERMPASEMQTAIDHHIQRDGMVYFQSINDLDLIAGHASLGLEILEELNEPDIVLVPCGGGALLAGIAAAIHLSRHRSCRVYGIEPEGAKTMWQSFQDGRALTMPASSIAAGLAPPFVGEHSYNICRQYIEDILVVPDEAIVRAVYQLYQQGLVVEPSGAVGYAALALNKVPDIAGKKIVVVISGGNVTVDEMNQIVTRAASSSAVFQHGQNNHSKL